MRGVSGRSALPSLALFVIGAVALRFGPGDLLTAFSALFVSLLACLGLVPWLAWALLLGLRIASARRHRDAALVARRHRAGLGHTGMRSPR